LRAPGAVELAEIGLEPCHPAHQAPPVDLELGLARTSGADATGLLAERPAPAPQPGQPVPQQGQLHLGAGTFDLGANIPPQPVTLLAPTVELVARSGLHPALSDLLIEAAREVHGHAGLLRSAGEFPAPLEHEYPISDDAARYYKSGKSFSYRHLPFWLATIVDRIVVVLIPALILLIPALRLIPAIYSWRVRRRIHRRYAELMALERLTLAADTEEQRQPLRQRLEEIDKAVITLKIPAAFADQVYVLREHIKFVRERLASGAPAAAQP